jgi:uncharacterized protein YjbI with pentapeptide repeats
MQKTLKNILIAHQTDSSLKIRSQKFFNEIIFEEALSGAILDRVNLSNYQFETVDLVTNSFFHCTFENCRFEDIAFYKSEFWGCTLQNCEIIECEATKVEFDKTIFKNCQFKQVDFGWSWFADCEFIETKLDDINFEATIISDLKTKNTTGLNLHFNERFPMNFWRLKECTKISDSLSFAKFLRDMNSD